VGKAVWVEQIQLLKERGNGREAAVDGRSRTTFPVLVLHEAKTLGATHRLWRNTHYSKEQLEIKCIVHPGMMGAGELEDTEKVVDLRRVRLHIDNLATSTDHHESNA
jgi:hypothetical protein